MRTAGDINVGFFRAGVFFLFPEWEVTGGGRVGLKHAGAESLPRRSGARGAGTCCSQSGESKAGRGTDCWAWMKLRPAQPHRMFVVAF